MRLFVFIAKIVVLVAITLWVNNNPGYVTIEWLDLHITTHIGVALFAILVTYIILHIIISQYRYLSYAPYKIKAWQQKRRQKKAHILLEQSLNFMAMELYDKAHKNIARAARLTHNSLHNVILAQIAKHNNDNTHIMQYYTALSQQPNLAFIGFMGLCELHIANNDLDRALLCLTEAERINNLTLPIIKQRHIILCLQKNWAEAINNINTASNNILAPETRHDYLAYIYWERACESTFPDNEKDLERVLRFDPTHSDCALNLANELYKNNQLKQAKNIIQQAWQHKPIMSLYNCWMHYIDDDSNETTKFQHIVELSAQNPTHQLSYYIHCEAAINAKLWKQAEIVIEEYFAIDTQKRLFDKRFEEWDSLVYHEQQQFINNHDNS